jgi:hypothetical protein
MKFDSLLTGILKTVAILALISLGLITILVEIEVLNGQHHHEASWHWHASAVLLTAFCLCATYLLITPSNDSLATIYCQRCHTLGGHTEISPYRSSVSGLSYHFGGFLLSIFYAGGRKHKFRCGSCGETFKSHTGTSRRYRILFFLMLALAVNSLWSAIDNFWNQ